MVVDYHDRQSIPHAEVFEAFPASLILDCYEQLDHAKEIAYVKTQKSPVLTGMGTTAYRDAFVVFAIEVDLATYASALEDARNITLQAVHYTALSVNGLKRADIITEKKTSIEIRILPVIKTKIHSVTLAYFYDQKKYYFDSEMQSYQEKWDKPVADLWQRAIGLLASYESGLKSFWHSHTKEAQLLIQQLQNSNNSELVRGQLLVAELKKIQNAKQGAYSKVLAVICDNIFESKPGLKLSIMLNVMLNSDAMKAMSREVLEMIVSYCGDINEKPKVIGRPRVHR